ncbi:mannose-1-phosphate guanylyltransferase/mannose-6-phosphate isomerase [Trinickia sp. LjRoot230]|uniref:mannose-1-phosphate guanylyltransferase/mannose-6-phosphate isomerase n=1 Tax=Trinickia sp. LjRoot230 TaxID=3342288 RepID=UPI003ECCC92E
MNADICTLVQPVVFAGGAGTRLWPLSRERYPKQLLDLFGTGTLLQTTVSRLDGLAGFVSGSQALRMADHTLVVCGESHRSMMQEQLREARYRARFIVEPVGRNTAPAMTVAALAARTSGPGEDDPILVAMPADHVIGDSAAFHASIACAIDHARRGAIATLGIVPARAETAFGYMAMGEREPCEGGAPGDAFAIDGFVEKPDRERAHQYVASGRYLWNSGIFIVRASVWIAAIQTYAPDIYSAAVAAVGARSFVGAALELDVGRFADCRSDSIDYAVMERIGTRHIDAGAGAPAAFRAVVVQLDAGWSDVGSWSELCDLADKDNEGNSGRGRAVFERCSNTFVRADHRLVACVGTEDLVVVETPDAVLVATRSHAQSVKQLVNRLKAGNAQEASEHRKVFRPWGYFDSLDRGERFHVKRIVVMPGERLSLQFHHHRAEHWIVVAGTARVTRGNDVSLLTEGETVHLPVGTPHRLENPGMVPLQVIEIQSGSYLGEDDIVRLEDAYGRVDKHPSAPSVASRALGEIQQ